MRSVLICAALLIFSCNNPTVENSKTSTPVKKDTSGWWVYPPLSHMNVEGALDSVIQVLNMQAEAWNAGDIDGFMKGYWQSDDLKFITKNGIRHGYDSVALNYKKHYNSKEKMGILEFSHLHCSSLQKDNELVNVTGDWKVTETSGKIQSGIFSLIFRKIGAEWKIIIDHTW